MKQSPMRNNKTEYMDIIDATVSEGNESPKKLANRITLFRALLIPVFISFVLYDQPFNALLIFFLAAITDVIDGLVARRWHQQTPLGAMLDPLADKFLIMSAFIMLCLKSETNLNLIPLWLTILVITRDTMIISISIIILMIRGYRSISPTLYGKIATFTQVSMIGLTLIFNNIGPMPSPLKMLLVWSVAFFTVLSGLHYLFRSAGSR